MMQCNLILEEVMIYGHLGDMDKAKELFEMYYQNRVDDYNDKMINGRQEYLKKGERIVYMNQDITLAVKNQCSLCSLRTFFGIIEVWKKSI